MTLASALFLSLTFAVLARRFGVFTRPLEVVATSREAYRALTDATLDDDAKEAIMQRSAKIFARHFVFILAASAAAVATPVGAIWVLAAVGLVSMKAVVAALVSWRGLVMSTLLIGTETWLERILALGTH